MDLLLWTAHSELLCIPVGSVWSRCAVFIAVWLIVSSTVSVSYLPVRQLLTRFRESSMESQDPEEVADSASELSALEASSRRG